VIVTPERILIPPSQVFPDFDDAFAFVIDVEIAAKLGVIESAIVAQRL
jgi:hypothetical protein